VRWFLIAEIGYELCRGCWCLDVMHKFKVDVVGWWRKLKDCIRGREDAQRLALRLSVLHVKFSCLRSSIMLITLGMPVRTEVDTAIWIAKQKTQNRNLQANSSRRWSVACRSKFKTRNFLALHSFGQLRRP